MNLLEAQNKIISLMADHELVGWRYGWINTRRTLGICNHTHKAIGLSRHFVRQTEWHAVEQVALHEIAHALMGHKAGHGLEWKMMAEAIGVINPTRCADWQVPGRYRAECGNCGRVSYMYRLGKNMNRRACVHCCNSHAGGKYDARFALSYVDTYVSRPKLASSPQPRETPMSEYSAPQLAEKIGTDPKTLRRFLRENDSFRNPGSGKRYSFTPREAESVEKAFTSWNNKRVRRSETTGDTRAKGKTQRDSAERKKRAQERVDALETSLKTRGVHISQHR